MSKGASQVGTQTSSAIDPLRKEQANYLAGGWQSARNLLEQSPQVPYPGPTYAPGTPEQYTGYGNLYNAGNIASTLNTQAQNPFYAATSGQYGVSNSPAYGGLQQIAGGYSPAMQQAAQNADLMSQYGQMGAQTGQQYAGNLAGVAGGVPGVTSPYMDQLGFNAATANAGNPAFGLLGQQASGAYLNSNPYIDRMYGSAADAVTRAYQTATAPKTESNYAGSGRYGSPSLGNARSQNEQNLGGTLNNLASNIYGTQYQNERQLQDAAATNLGQQYLTGVGRSTEASQAGGQLGLGTAQQQISGYNAASNQGLAGYTQALDALARGGALGLANTSAQQQALTALQGGYQSGNAQALAGSELAKQLIQNNITGAQAQTQGGAGYQALTQAQYDDAQKRYLAQQASPWENLQNYMKLIGQPTGQSSISQQPIYGSPLAQTIGALGAGSNLLFGQNSGGLLGNLGLGGAGAGAAADIGADFGGIGIAPLTGASSVGTAAASGLGGLFGGGGLGGLLGSIFGPASIFSDRRLKEDTQVVGNLGALPIHVFSYKGDPTRRVGFMADEVERIDPGAVMDTSIGFKAVDYGRAAASALAGA